MATPGITYEGWRETIRTRTSSIGCDPVGGMSLELEEGGGWGAELDPNGEAGQSAVSDSRPSTQIDSQQRAGKLTR